MVSPTMGNRLHWRGASRTVHSRHLAIVISSYCCPRILLKPKRKKETRIINNVISYVYMFIKLGSNPHELTLWENDATGLRII